jgi:hypothetical protein
MTIASANLQEGRRIAWSCLAIVLALLVVGWVSHGVLRHIVQTAPLWFGVVLGFRGSETSKWVALPPLVFWLTVMIFIWLFLMGWARIVTGTFSPTEIAMTIVVGCASILGLFTGLRMKTSTSGITAVLLLLIFSGLQLLTFRLSLLPQIAHR